MGECREVQPAGVEGGCMRPDISKHAPVAKAAQRLTLVGHWISEHHRGVLQPIRQHVTSFCLSVVAIRKDELAHHRAEVVRECGIPTRVIYIYSVYWVVYHDFSEGRLAQLMRLAGESSMGCILTVPGSLYQTLNGCTHRASLQNVGAEYRMTHGNDMNVISVRYIIHTPPHNVSHPRTS